MVKKILILLLAIAIKINAQVNLVPNPSFESYTACPDYFSQLIYAKPWFPPSTGTPDYYNACASATTGFSIPSTVFGFSYAHLGNAMSGILNSDGVFGASSKKYREYLAIKLQNQLVNGTKYFLTYYVKLADSSHYASKSLSVLFRTDSISKNNNDTINAIPQINNTPSNYITSKNSWTKLSGSFVATGNLKYMYLGNFKPDVTNDTLFVGPGTLVWYLNNNFPYYFYDDICLSTDSLYSENWVGIKKFQKNTLKIFPNPVINNLSIEGADSESEFQLWDLLGNKINIVREKNMIDLSGLTSGIYFLYYELKNKQHQIYKLIKQ